MTLPLEAAALVLLAALLHASWNAVVKIGGDRLVTMAIMNGVGIGVCALALPLVPFPAPAAWAFLLPSAALHTAYYFVLIRAYRVGDLSHVYPLARGLSPMLVAGAGAAFAGEAVSALGLAGVVLACSGIASLAFASGPPWRGDARPLAWAAAVAMLIAAYTITDGLGVRRAGSAVAYIAWLSFIDGLPIVLVALALRRRALVAVLRSEWRKGCAGGALQLGAYGLVIWAMSVGTMASVSALRETSVIFAAIIGTRLLGEPFGRLRIAAAAVVAAGVVLIKFAG